MSEFIRIKASAGSGKTHALTSRFLQLLAGASDAPWSTAPCGSAAEYGWKEILAMTFTNKAAAEMRERLVSRLKACALGIGHDDFWTAGKAACAVDTLIRNSGALNIRTIDSLLHLILRASAIDFDLAPDFTPQFDDKKITGPLFDLLAEKARTGGEDSLARDFREACSRVVAMDGFRGFMNADGVRNKVLGLASVMITRTGWRTDQLATPERFHEMLLSKAEAVRSAAGNLAGILSDEQLPASRNMQAALQKCLEHGASPTRMRLDSALLKKEALDECLLKAGRGRASAKAEQGYAELRSLAHEMRVLQHAAGLMPFADLARRVYGELQEYELSTGSIASSQIPELAVRAAADEPADDGPGTTELFCRMSSRITHILVDEFQDTSREQMAAILPLAVEALARGGSLTVVGDVKQAIYGWRGGDSSLFDAIATPEYRLATIVPKPESRSLPFNRRSTKTIVEWNNRLFAPLADREFASALLEPLTGRDALLLDEQTGLLNAAFLHSEQQTDLCPPGGMVRIRDLDGDDENILHGMLPGLVREIGRRQGMGGICILTRTGRQAATAASWLMEHRIPVVTQGSLVLSEQPLIMEFTDLFRFLNEQDDDTAFWNVIAGRRLLPAMPDGSGGLLDAERLRPWAAQRTGRGALHEEFRRSFPGAWDAVFAPVIDESGLLTPYDLAAELVERWGVRERNRTSEGFLQRFLEVLSAAEENGVSDLSGFLEFWEENGASEKAPLPESLDAVSIMTMHSAKGLQFKAVIIPWTDAASGGNREPETVFRMCGDEGVLVSLCEELGAEWHRKKAEGLREGLNLLYVAMTRAVEELHVFLPSSKDAQASALDALAAPLRSGMKADENGFLTLGAAPVRRSAAGTEAGEGKDEGPAPPEAAGDMPCTGGNDGEDGGRWRPMGWLPRLRIFHSVLEDGPFTAAKRGTLAHHCLECLASQPGGTPHEDALRAVELGMADMPPPENLREALRREISGDLEWYASLPGTARRLAFGDPEHSLLDGGGGMHRVDLLVDDGKTLEAVEYKTGTPGDLPDPKHLEQLRGYLELLREATGRPVRGELVYLDRRRIIPVVENKEDGHGRTE